MTINFFFMIVLITLFLIPGPSNALFAYVAYKKNIVSAFKYLPYEYLGYIYAIALCSLFVHIMQPYWPALINILHSFSLIYVLWLASHLWKANDLYYHLAPQKELTSSAMFYATLRNPKTILLTVGILPIHTWYSSDNFIRMMLLLLLIMVPTALFWMFFGRSLLHNNLMGLKAKRLYRFSAVILILCTVPMLLSLIYLE